MPNIRCILYLAGGLAVQGLAAAASERCGLDSWVEHAELTPQWLRAVAYGNGMFVAVGDNGSLIKSTDGAAWQRVPANPADYFAGAAYLQGRFFITGRRFTAHPFAWDGLILSSTNGLDWTESYRSSNVV